VPLLAAVSTACLVLVAPASAGTDSGLCSHTTSRGAISADFPLDACFDGSVLVVANRSEIPVIVAVLEGGGGVPRSEAATPTPPLASKIFQEAHSSHPGVLMPGYKARIPVGAGRFRARLEGTNFHRSYPLVRWLVETVPGISSYNSVLEASNELLELFDQHGACLARSGWAGDVACEALYQRNIAFALGRLGINVAGDLVGAVANLLGTAKWADDAVGDLADLVNGNRTIELGPAPAPPPPAPAAPVPAAPAAAPAAPAPAAPPPAQPPSGTTAPPRPATNDAQQGSRGANTFQNPVNASGQGPRIEPNMWVQVSCKLRPAQTIDSAYPDGYWYRIASAPWNNQYYAVANTFWNGDNPSTPREQWHNTDYSIPDC
jgi:hypothetical protein